MGFFGAKPQIWGHDPEHLAVEFSGSDLKPGTPVDHLVVRPAIGRDYLAIESVRRANRAWLSPWEATLPPGSTERLPGMGGYQRRCEKQMRDSLGLYMVIEADEEAAGTISIAGVQHGAMSQGVLGYWIGEQWARQGITSLAVAAVIDMALLQLGLHRLEINVRPENEPSLRLCHSIGLRREGLKPRFMCIGGQWRDHVGFSVDREMLQQEPLVERLRRKRQ
ncbi:GNAT family N-acetyltransferase [Actinomycetaceae bacterium WB03_NA08]|uniref:GNAT family N-acetyltransferase n=1 Tax=Scrofimicrobium canadense TaxID=2652290 RepID=A0A6N7WA92_9ACTO|nr:GNAT family protein [Scrofimicrobium canadense]MSS85156.1 GNAT family N-acetyltransferase [Scrofimicrobium canadense]